MLPSTPHHPTVAGVKASFAILVLAYLAFVSLGLPDAVIGVAWPSIRKSFDLPQAFLGVPIAVTAGAYFVSGMLAGRVMQSLGLGSLLGGSTALVTVGLFGYAAAPAFAVILPAAVIVGFGSGAIDSALNTYAARHFSPKHVSWLHAAYSVGATAGPAILTAVLAGGGSWRLGYLVIGLLLAALVPPFVLARKHWETPPSDSETVLDAPDGTGPFVITRPRVTAFDALRSPRVRLQLVLFFLYAGAEMAAGQWSYTVLTEARGLSPSAAGTWVSAFWGALLVGRLVLALVIERIGQVTLVRLATFGVLFASLLFALDLDGLSLVALPLLAFSFASIYPGLMSETPRRVGDAIAPHAVGFQVSAATLGIAAVPSLAGVLGERFGLDAIGWVIVCGALLLVVVHERLVAVADRG